MFLCLIIIWIKYGWKRTNSVLFTTCMHKLRPCFTFFPYEYRIRETRVWSVCVQRERKVIKREKIWHVIDGIFLLCIVKLICIECTFFSICLYPFHSRTSKFISYIRHYVLLYYKIIENVYFFLFSSFFVVRFIICSIPYLHWKKYRNWKYVQLWTMLAFQ